MDFYQIPKSILRITLDTTIANRDLQKEGCLATGLEAASSRRRLLGKGDQ
jgi:hypothetical protein